MHKTASATDSLTRRAFKFASNLTCPCLLIPTVLVTVVLVKTGAAADNFGRLFFVLIGDILVFALPCSACLSAAMVACPSADSIAEAQSTEAIKAGRQAFRDYAWLIVPNGVIILGKTW